MNTVNTETIDNRVRVLPRIPDNASLNRKKGVYIDRDYSYRIPVETVSLDLEYHLSEEFATDAYALGEELRIYLTEMGAPYKLSGDSLQATVMFDSFGFILTSYHNGILIQPTESITKNGLRAFNMLEKFCVDVLYTGPETVDENPDKAGKPIDIFYRIKTPEE